MQRSNSKSAERRGEDGESSFKSCMAPYGRLCQNESRKHGAWNLIRDGLTLKTCYLESNMIEEDIMLPFQVVAKKVLGHFLEELQPSTSRLVHWKVPLTKTD
ncbi:hypothetical protein Peur_036638 [Populus x canadensis]